MNYQLIQSPSCERYPDVSGKPVRWYLSSAHAKACSNESRNRSRLKKLSMTLSVVLVSACSSLEKFPGSYAKNIDSSGQPINCRHVQRDLSVAWDRRYYWCQNGHQEQLRREKVSAGPDATKKSPGKTKTEIPRTASLTASSAPMVFDAIPTPQSKKNKSEPAEVFSDPKALRKTISKTPINLPTTFSAASDKLPAPLESKIKEKVEARAEAEVKVKPKKAIENQISDPWQSVTSRIWFVSGLHVLGPKSTAKLLDVIDQLHPLKTIWLDGRLLPSELTRLSPDQAKLLMVSRALSVRKALQKAGVKTEIRIKHPKLVAEGRYVSLEQGR